MNATMQMISEPQGVTLSGLAREELKRADGRIEMAIGALTERLSMDAALLKAIVRDAVSDAINLHVTKAMRQDRAAILDQTTRGKDAVIALANGLTRALLDMPLAGGLPLRDATRAQVLESSERYAATAKDAGHKAKWLQAIAQCVPDGKTVGEVLTDERAADLYRESA